jgi:hypothetical protein
MPGVSVDLLRRPCVHALPGLYFINTGDIMQKQSVEELIEFLETQADAVRRLEEEGNAALETEGQRAFQVKAEAKAEILAALAEDAWKFTQRIEGDEGKAVAQRLEQFSMSASTALRIGSVFFMTALLYPEDHQPGEPNDLDVFIGELKAKL